MLSKKKKVAKLPENTAFPGNKNIVNAYDLGLTPGTTWYRSIT